MTYEQYKAEQRRLRLELESQMKQLDIKFANSHNKVKVGDIVRDHICRIKVEKIGYYVSQDKPMCTYSGTKVRANGDPVKSNTQHTAYQQNLL
jgi:hypothetical protein